MNNLAAKIEYRDLIKCFEEDVRAKWDVEALTKQVLLSQKRRRLISDAMQHGTPVSWNHGERIGDDVPWYRGGGAYNEWALTHLAADGSLVQPGPVLSKAGPTSEPGAKANLSSIRSL
jgi:choline-sulfatase